jgi:signal transduction histidine kinase
MSGPGQRVCVLAPIGRDARLSVEMLQGAGIEAAACDTVDDLCRSITDDAGALLVAEEALRPEALRTLVNCLDQQPPWSDIAVIVLAGSQFTSSSERPLTVLGPLRNVTILERPVRRLILSRTVAIALRGRRRQLELRAYLEERAGLLRREQLANRMKDEFLMTVSHELRTPLTAIRGHVDAMREGLTEDPDAEAASLDVIAVAAARLERLVGDVLDLAKLDSHRFTVLREEVDMGQLLDLAYATYGEEARRRSIHYRCDIDARPVILTDGDRVLQIISNLLSNAFRWTPDGGRVELGLSASNGAVSVVVEDTGPGIRPEERERIFRPFFSHDHSRDGGGTGLGLAIASELALALGGRIELDTSLGKGSRFKLVLPASPPA